MIQTVESIYEKNVLKPIEPIEGIKERERVAVILCSLTQDGHFDHIHGLEVINWGEV